MTASRSLEARGRTAIDDKVTRTIISEALLRVPGTVKLERLGRRSFPRIDASVDPEYRTVSVEAFVACEFPAPVTSVAEMCRRAIAGAVHSYLGYDCESVSVVVGTVVHTDGELTLSELRAFDPTPTPEPIVVNRNTKLHHITTHSFYGSEPDKPVVVNKQLVQLTPIERPPRAEVRGVVAPPRMPIRGVSVPERHEPVSIRPPRRAPLRSVSAPSPITPIKVSAPQRRAPLRPSVSRAASARGVRAPKRVEPFRPIARSSAKRLQRVRRSPQVPTIAPTIRRTVPYPASPGSAPARRHMTRRNLR